MNNRRTQQKSPIDQQGSVLLWGLVILLTLTMIGIAAARVGVTDLRIAGNQMFEMMAYQGAESTLERITIDSSVAAAANAGEYSESWQDSSNNDGLIASKGTITLQGEMMCVGGMEGSAMSIQMGSEQGAFSCLYLTVSAKSQVSGTGARSTHEVGVLRMRAN